MRPAARRRGRARAAAPRDALRRPGGQPGRDRPRHRRPAPQSVRRHRAADRRGRPGAALSRRLEGEHRGRRPQSAIPGRLGAGKKQKTADRRAGPAGLRRPGAALRAGGAGAGRLYRPLFSRADARLSQPGAGDLLGLSGLRAARRGGARGGLCPPERLCRGPDAGGRRLCRLQGLVPGPVPPARLHDRGRQRDQSAPAGAA